MEITRRKDERDTSAASLLSCKEAEEQHKKEIASLQNRNAHMLREKEVSLISLSVFHSCAVSA